MSEEYYKIRKHTKLINKIDCKNYKNNNIIVSASRDGSVKIFDIRTKQEHIMFNKIFFNYLSLKRLTNITQLNHITILFLLYLIIINVLFLHTLDRII
ncbi:hypothetical protein PFFCH_04296 [Plasmodium falciparum FCH/4]|uniref:Uncharacterized protein n=1 Tax=Plasmodium falciparum FCH/4 TaxID=1036724 RepID=A0A024VJF9_PLAFA|nr:hypothetical protein PFFCH_04296 [Plasmodium falciparum FCH/4]